MSNLKITTYNPTESGIFPISSNLIEGDSEVILIDAQFQKNDAQEVVKLIEATGKKLSTIYISHGDPDFYFGLDVIKAAFPEAVVLSSPSTNANIHKSMVAKLAYWGPILKENAPAELFVPDVLVGDKLFVDGNEIQIIGLDGHDPKHTFIWIPSLKTILGGISIFDNMHAWMADTKTPESRQIWQQTLDVMTALKPELAIPGHFLGERTNNVSSIDFIRSYIKSFDAAASSSKDSTALIEKMKENYPAIGGDVVLATSAKVVTGEMPW